jgi:hypothetical protein
LPSTGSTAWDAATGRECVREVDSRREQQDGAGLVQRRERQRHRQHERRNAERDLHDEQREEQVRRAGGARRHVRRHVHAPP